MVSRFKIFYHLPSLKENYNEADQIGSSSLFLPPIAVFDNFILSRVKDGAIVPGQVGLSGLPTLVRGPYPH